MIAAPRTVVSAGGRFFVPNEAHMWTQDTVRCYTIGMTYRRGNTSTRNRSRASTDGGTTTDRNTVARIITDEVIKQLEDGIVPWRQPWAGGGLPLSVSTGKAYRGINPFLLNVKAMGAGYRSQWWGTSKKIREMGGTLGAEYNNHTIVIFWKWIYKDVVDDRTGKIKKQGIPLLRFYKVYNLDQVQSWTDGMPAKYTTAVVAPQGMARVEAAEAIIAGYANPPTFRTGDAAYYKMTDDSITMPPRETFESADAYYRVMFHEMVHSTGVDKRLKVPGFSADEFGKFGTKPYSAEELRAEGGSTLLAAHAGIKLDVENSAAYIAGWLTRLRDPDNARLLVDVFQRATKAVDYIRGISWDDKDADEE